MKPLVPDTSFHIFNHANGFDNVFKEAENYRFFLEKYQLHIAPIAETYAYCLMPNHFHLVVRIRKREVIENLIRNKNNSLVVNTSNSNTSKVLNFGSVTDNEIEKFLSKQFANLFSSYTQSFNKVYHRMGSLFIKNFKREPIADKTHFFNAIVYTHRNPIHHGFCKGFEEWPYSSYPGIIYGVEGIVENDKMLKMAGSIDDFIELHKINLARFESKTSLEIP
jgi:putative transposase